MEDAHAHELTLGDGVDGKKTSFFAVYDGHGGKQPNNLFRTCGADWG